MFSLSADRMRDDSSPRRIDPQREGPVLSIVRNNLLGTVAAIATLILACAAAILLATCHRPPTPPFHKEPVGASAPRA